MNQNYKITIMKKIITILLTTLLSTITINQVYAADEKPAVASTEPQSKKICVDVLDNKTNKKVNKCRTMKVHKKHEGTKVPEGKK